MTTAIKQAIASAIATGAVLLAGAALGGCDEGPRAPVGQIDEPPMAQMPVAHEQPDAIEIDTSVRPFREIGDRLGDRGLNHSINRVGVATFDANGDGLLDMFFAKDQRPVFRRVEGGVLTDEKMPVEPNTLFLHQGNDADGNPTFASLQDLVAAGNPQYVEEELLIEGKYRPRTAADQDETGPGRLALGAVSADFNGDGRIDLYVLNAQFGISFQTEQMGIPVYPPLDQLGRDARRELIKVRMPPFLREPLQDGLHAMVHHGAIPEPEGSNRLYLNLGDRDQDGIPEWADATEEAGVGGRWYSLNAAVVDYDRDGDLDLYVANFMDRDYWGFGMDRFGGHRNQLYQNQLVETGQLAFKDVASELKVAGLHDEEGLTSSVYFPNQGEAVETSEQIVDGELVGEKADHTWSSLFYDYNGDGWMDLAVANDVGNRLRIYENVQGREFRRVELFDAPRWEGCWMGMSAGDLSGDGLEELFITGCGSQIMSSRNTRMFVDSDQENNIWALTTVNYIGKRNTTHHEILRYRPGEGFRGVATEVKVHHSPHIPPDQTQIENFPQEHLDIYHHYRFADSLTGLEFAWNAPFFDVDNDGDLDMYFIGSFQRGNDNFIGDWSGTPGRMMVNESAGGELALRDRTLEYRLLDIEHMDYDHNPPRRPAPGTGWHKRDMIYLTDVDSYSGMGVAASKSHVRDLFRMHEAAGGGFTADLNDDGYPDLIVPHRGGYNSLSPEARNLKVEVDGQVRAVPARNKIVKAPTTYEAGRTFLYMNSGPPEGELGRWVKIRLTDTSRHNVHAIGAKVTVNGTIVRRMRATNGDLNGGTHEDLHFGLGEGSLRTVEIVWPSGDPMPHRIALEQPVEGQTVCIDRREGLTDCHARDGLGALWAESWPDTDFEQHTAAAHDVYPAPNKEKHGPHIPIDHPASRDFQVASEVDQLDAAEPVVAVQVGDDVRAYPLNRILAAHIVNDTVGGVPVLVSFCVLCDSSAVFERSVDGVPLEFATSYLLLDANLVMFDRQTKSWWPQLLGEAVAGDLTGKALRPVPSRVESFDSYRRRHPDGLVLMPADRPAAKMFTGYGTRRHKLFAGQMPDDMDPFTPVVAVGDRAWTLDLLRDKKRIVAEDGVVLTWSPNLAEPPSDGPDPRGEDHGNVIAQQTTDEGAVDVPYVLSYAFAFVSFHPDAGPITAR